MIKIEADYRAIVELEDEWDCTISDIFNWAAQDLLKIWETDYLRLHQESEPISKEKADEIFHMLTLDGQNLFEHLECDFRPRAFEHHTGNDYAIKNGEIKRFERLFKKPESEEEREARLAKKKLEATARSEAVFNANFGIPTEKPTQTNKSDNPIKTHPETQNTENMLGHPYFAEELLIANLCWIDLYCDRRQNAPTPKEGHKKMIENWLEEHYPKKSKSSSFKDRIATVVNPNKKGGSPRIGY